MRLAVVVASVDGPERLRLCLEALEAQPEVSQIVVCEKRDERNLPELFARGLPEVRAEVVALLEGRARPEPGWASALLEAHRENREAFAVGGPVLPPEDASSFEQAFYASEFGGSEVSEANVSYKADRLSGYGPVMADGAWGHEIRALENGGFHWASEAAIRYPNPYRPVEFLRQRFAYGRAYAARRVKGLSRLGYAFGCLGLPLLILWRQRGAVRPGSLLWVVLFDSAWAAGEFVGYLVGGSQSTGIV